MPSDAQDADEIERGECAFCDLKSDIVLTVTDPAPKDMSIIDDSLALPVCRPHFEDMEDGAI